MLTTLIFFIIILGVLVFVHELGHFISAKKLGARVEEFGFGFPPRMVGVYKDGKKWKFCYRKTPKTTKTIYSLNWIPIGGFVKIKGEDGECKAEPDSFCAQALWKRAVILVAGVTMNVVLAMIFLGIGFGIGIPQVLENGAPKGATLRERNIQVVSVTKDSPASRAGIETGDIILALDGVNISFKDIEVYQGAKRDKEIIYKINRYGAIIEKNIVPEILEGREKLEIGVGLVETAIVSYPWYKAIYMGIFEALYFVKEISVAFGILFKNLFLGQGLAMDISGPVGIAVITGKVARLGFIYLLQFSAFLSINLAIINALPFPALDGGRLLFLAIEAVRKKPVSQRVEATIHNLGFLLLMILIIAVTYRDFVKFGDKFVNLWHTIIK